MSSVAARSLGTSASVIRPTSPYLKTPPLAMVLPVHTQSQAETARRLAVETWLQRNGVITITQNKKVLPVFREQSAHN